MVEIPGISDIGYLGGGVALLILILWWFFFRKGEGRLQEDKEEMEEESRIRRRGKEEIKMDIDIDERCRKAYANLVIINKKCKKLGLQIETDKKSDTLIKIERALNFLENSNSQNAQDPQAKVAIRQIHENSRIYLTQLMKVLRDIKPTAKIARFRVWRIRRLAVKLYDHLKHIEAEVEIRNKIDEAILMDTRQLEMRVERKVGHQ